MAVLFSVCRALFAYDGIMNRLKLADSGGKSTESFMFLCVLELAFMPFSFIVGGLQELSTKLHPRLPLYGMCRVGTAQPCIVMILWVSSSSTKFTV